MTDARESPVVVMGTGSIGLRHLRVFGALGVPAFALPARASRAHDADVRSFDVIGSLEEAVARGAARAVVATNTSRHVADATAALDAGLHVLVEKPLASDVNGVDEIARSAKARSRRVYVACCLRFHETLVAFRARLAEVGPIVDVRIECRSFLPDWRPAQDYRTSYSARADEGGVLRDLIHEIDYAVWLFGAPDEVAGRLGAGTPISIEADASADLLWTVPSGATVSIRLDYLSRVPSRFVEVNGEGGVLRADLVRGRIEAQRPGEARVQVSVPHERDFMMAEQARAFLRGTDGGDAGALASFEEGVTALAICDAARASSTRRSVVRVHREVA